MKTPKRLVAALVAAVRLSLALHLGLENADAIYPNDPIDGSPTIAAAGEPEALETCTRSGAAASWFPCTTIGSRSAGRAGRT